MREAGGPAACVCAQPELILPQSTYTRCRVAHAPTRAYLSCADAEIAPLGAAIRDMWAAVWIDFLTPVALAVEVRVLAAQRARRNHDAIRRPTQ